jgi:hypothetical protein
MAQHNRFTIYDALDAKGAFSANPANPGSRDVDGNSLYHGPVEYPKMLYSPTGATEVIVPGEVVVTPFGPERRAEQRVLVSRLVYSAEEEAAARAEGWHDHPAKSIEAGGQPRPPMGAGQQIADAKQALSEADRRIAELEKRLAEAQAQAVAALTGTSQRRGSQSA